MAEEKPDGKKEGKIGDGAKATRSSGRGPSFPSISFPAALDLVRKVYDNSHVRSISDLEAVAAMGYASINGTSSTRLAALRRYGLLVSQGDGTRVSGEAVVILEMGKSDPEAAAYIKEMALRPAAFGVMFRRFGEKVPQENVARVFLTQNGFQGEAANTLIRVYKETIAYVQDAERTLANAPSARKEAPPVEKEKTGGNIPSSAEEKSAAVVTKQSQDTVFNIPENTVRYAMSRDSFATIIFSGVVTQEGIEKLRQYLDLSLDIYPSVSELTSTSLSIEVDPNFFDEEDNASSNDSDDVNLFDEDDA